ncbi:hypothetical protein BMT17_06455 [Bacillus thuringiensis serovar kurstaki]|nr:hypothetical protein BMT17_06455 [Bacillus thuringiensis serovar kurstaki]
MNQANKERNKTLYLELHNAYQKQGIRDLEIQNSYQLCILRNRKVIVKQKTEVFRVADLLKSWWQKRSS